MQDARRTRQWSRRKQFCQQHQWRHPLPDAHPLPHLAVFIPQAGI